VLCDVNIEVVLVLALVLDCVSVVIVVLDESVDVG